MRDELHIERGDERWQREVFDSNRCGVRPQLVITIFSGKPPMPKANP